MPPETPLYYYSRENIADTANLYASSMGIIPFADILSIPFHQFFQQMTQGEIYFYKEFSKTMVPLFQLADSNDHIIPSLKILNKRINRALSPLLVHKAFITPHPLLLDTDGVPLKPRTWLAQGKDPIVITRTLPYLFK